jgi:hypothetical protein
MSQVCVPDFYDASMINATNAKLERALEGVKP